MGVARLAELTGWGVERTRGKMALLADWTREGERLQAVEWWERRWKTSLNTPTCPGACWSGRLARLLGPLGETRPSLTSMQAVEPSSRGLPFYKEIRTRLVAQARSDSTGFFEVALEPGTYSVFVREGSLYYANWFDGYGHIFPVEVAPNRVTEIRFDITYEATW